MSEMTSHTPPGEAPKGQASPPSVVPPTLHTPATHKGQAPAFAVGDFPLRLPCDFAGYELLEEVARGGMGVIYKARQKSLGRVVALKMILPGMLGSDHAVRRFYQEAQAAGGLDHPGIVPIYEAGEHQGRHFFTMAFVEGQSLASWVRARGLPPLAEAVRIAGDVAEAVEHAHRKGILHRDLKPDNILIEAGGRVRVTDFGLSKQLGDGHGELTRTGQVLGTPSYMAPEQALGHTFDIGPPTDVFALGGVLNYLLTRHPPFSGDSIPEMLYKVVHEPPVRPRAHVPTIPPAVEEVCLRCLDKEPARRFPSAGELARALRAAAAGSGAVATSGSLARRRLAWAASLLVVLGAAAGGVYFYITSHTNRPTEEAKENPAPAPQVTAKAPAKAPAPAEAPVTLEVGPLRQDFGLKVRVLGAEPDAKGVVRLRDGQAIRLQVTVERDAHVGIWAIDRKGVVMQLFPHEAEPNALVRAGAPRVLPGPDFEFAADPTDGVEQFQVVASTRPLDKLHGQRKGGFLEMRTPEQQKEFADTRRGLRLRQTARLAEQVISYEVGPQR
jgi:predicted Ser/Thr protein kinase